MINHVFFTPGQDFCKQRVVQSGGVAVLSCGAVWSGLAKAVGWRYFPAGRSGAVCPKGAR